MIADFFKSNSGKYSMARLIWFMTWFPSTYVIITTKTDTALCVYLGAHVLGFVGDKAATRRIRE